MSSSVVTDVAGVEVRLGDKVLGVTSKAEHDDGPLAASEEAQLLVDEMPLGPRTLLLAKPCFRTRSFPVSVSADLLDRTPVRVEVPPIDPSRGTLRLRGGSAGNRVLVDGAEAGTLPTDPLAVCAGRRRIAVVAGGREVFSAEVDVAEDAETALAIAATPAIALLGAETWPKELAALAEMAIRPRAFPLRRGSDLSTAQRS